MNAVSATSERYERNRLIPQIGFAGQARLASASVCVVGLGGLGSPAALYLAAAGVGTLGLIDSDVVELSNLQRQILHTTSRIGRPKTASAAEAIAALNPEVTLRAVRERIRTDNARGVLAGYDVVVDATDSFESKLCINDACLDLAVPLATAGILGLSGQALFVVPGESPCLRCMLPEPPDGVPTTAEFGVLGALPGILGSVQALAVIRWIVGIRPAGGLVAIDGEAMRLATLGVERRAGCRCEKLGRH